jgi:hypothetical protein
VQVRLCSDSLPETRLPASCRKHTLPPCNDASNVASASFDSLPCMWTSSLTALFLHRARENQDRGISYLSCSHYLVCFLFRRGRGALVGGQISLPVFNSIMFKFQIWQAGTEHSIAFIYEAAAWAA